MGHDWQGLQSGSAKPEVREAITQIGLDFRLMTQFTSFVAVEEMVVTEGGQARRIEVPVEMPEGVSYEGIFGKEGDRRIVAMQLNATVGVQRHSSVGQRADQAVGGFIARDEAAAKPAMLSPAEQERRKMQSKLHPDLESMIQQIRSGKMATAGQATVQIFLTDDSPAALDQLKKLGVEITVQPKSGKLVIGRVPLAALAAVAQLNVVRYMAPYTGR
jgi:hypothetical protein